MTKNVDNLKQQVGERIKQAIERLGTTQKLFAKAAEIPLPSLGDYVRGKSMPGGEAIYGITCVGVNANWLLTGEGPMLLSDMPSIVESRINVDALEAIIEGALKVAQKAPPSAIAAHAAHVYAQCIENGLITPDGVGEGKLESAA